jgi:type IV secretion system protein VirD4
MSNAAWGRGALIGVVLGVLAAWLLLVLFFGLAELQTGHGPAMTVFGPALAPWHLVAWARRHDPAALSMAEMLALVAFAYLGWNAAHPRQTADAYASTAWRPFAQWTPLLRTTLWKPGAVVPASGFVVGIRGRHNVVVVPTDIEHHIVLLGTTGAGKTRRHMIPTIIVLGQNRANIVVSDLKGELAPAMGPWLKGQGYHVMVLDFEDPVPRSDAVQWNPMQPILAALEDGNLPAAADHAWDLGHLLAGDRPAQGGGDNDDFWRQSQEALLTALVLGVGEVAPEGSAHLGSVHRTLTEHQDVLDGWFATFADDHPARSAYANIKLSADVTRMGILTTTTAQLRLFTQPGMAWLTSGHDPVWPMGSSEGDTIPWLAQPVAVFLRLPHETTRAKLVTLFLHQLIGSLRELADHLPGQRLPQPTWFLLDEFGNIPALPDFAKNITLLRSYGFRFVMAVQDLQQIGKLYPGDQETILGNAGTWVFLGTNSRDTAERISKMTGQRTVDVESSTQQAGSRSVTTSKTERALRTPDDLMIHWKLPGRGKPGSVLVIQQGAAPVLLDNQDISQTAWAHAMVPDAERGAAGALPEVPFWPPPDQRHDDADAWDLEPVPDLTAPEDIAIDSVPF